MSEPEANPADVVEQQLDAVPDETLEDEEIAVPDDANPADVIEQSIVVPEDDEDIRG